MVGVGRGRATALAVVVVAALGLTSCVGIGAVNRGAVTARAQERGGGVTAGLVADALDAVAEASGQDPLRVQALTASFTTVTLVVAGSGGDGGLESWRYGTSGMYGGRGVTGPEPVGGEVVAGTLFTAEEAGLDGLDAMVDRARATAGRPGGWVETVTVTRPVAGEAPTVTLLVSDRGHEVAVVMAPDGTPVEGGDG